MNIGNPYSFLVSTIRNQGSMNSSEGIQLGKVISTSPLTVSIGDLQLISNNLLLADYLKEGYERTISLNGIENSYSFKGDIAVNDTLALMKINSSTFLILCKVVLP